MNILEEVQQYVADKLNADPQLSACPFLVENRRDIDFEIKQALGKQGIVGLVMTPKATYAGAYMDAGIAWQIDELEIDVVENVTVNRGKKSGYITGQDAAMRLFEVLCPLSGEHEGQFNPVSYEEGEDNSLLVNKSVLKCLVHKLPDLEMRTKVTYADGSSLMVEVEGVLSSSSIPSINDVVEVEIGNAVTSIGEHAFDRCAYLETVVIPKSVETIGTQGFSRTVRLTNVTIEGNGLKVIGNGAFAAATALTSISLPDSIISIGRSAFEDCVQLTSIVIPASVQTMDREVFFGCSELMNVTFSGKDKATVKGMANYSWALPSGCVIHCTDGNIVVGSETKVTYQNGDVVEYDINGELTRGQISGLTSIVSLDIGRGVTSLATNAFYSCTNLSSVTIPDSVTSIGGAAFMNCYRLSSVVIPDSVSSMDGSTFYGCIRLLDASLGNGLSSVPNATFDGCTSLSSVTLPQNAVSIDDGAFAKCTSLRSIDIPDSVTSLNNSAFQRCSSLVDVHMPSSLTAIYEYAFDRCSSLSSVVIPEGVTHIGADAFIGCTATTDVYCYPNPANLTWDEADKDDFKHDGSTICHVSSSYLGQYISKFGNTVNVTFVGGDQTAVQYKSGLTRSLDIEGQLTYHSIPSVIYVKDVVIGNAVTSIGEGAFEQCSNLTNVNIPGSVKTIGDAAFLGCTALSSAVISEGVETIDDSAFTNCKVLNNITIPSSVQNIGEDAFFSCDALYSITFSGKDRQTVQGMSKYPWRLQTGCVIHCTDGDITI